MYFSKQPQGSAKREKVNHLSYFLLWGSTAVGMGEKTLAGLRAAPKTASWAPGLGGCTAGTQEWGVRGPQGACAFCPQSLASGGCGQDATTTRQSHSGALPGSSPLVSRYCREATKMGLLGDKPLLLPPGPKQQAGGECGGERSPGETEL